jgi:hypothetical protein
MQDVQKQKVSHQVKWFCQKCGVSVHPGIISHHKTILNFQSLPYENFIRLSTVV